MPKVSIIVPIYNAEQFIDRTIRSLLAQTLYDIEIICVLDNPTDRTQDIVEGIAFQNSQIKIIYNTETIGTAASRNKGISIAQGEYIGFSDHDDIHDCRMYELLYTKAKDENSDIVISDSILYNAVTGEEIEYHYNSTAKNDIISSILYPQRHFNYLSRSVWSNIYKRSFLIEYKITFLDRQLYYEEDTLFNLSALLKATTIGYVNQCLYIWCRTPQTQSNAFQYLGIQPVLNAIDKEIELILDDKQAHYYMTYIRSYLEDWLQLHYHDFRVISTSEKQKLKRICNTIHFSVFSHYPNLQWMSRLRIKLYCYIFYIKYLL